MTQEQVVSPQPLTEAHRVSAAQIIKAAEEAVASRDFLKSSSLVNKALKALEIPDPLARFRRQFRGVARRNLLAKASTDEHGNIRPPSPEAINVELERLLANLRAKQA